MARWRVCPVNKLYAVSDRGSVRNKKTRRVVKSYPNGNRYLRVQLCRLGKPKNYLVHRLVLITFKGPPPAPGMEGAHIDGRRRNNALANLYWATKEQNTADRVRHHKARKCT